MPERFRTAIALSPHQRAIALQQQVLVLGSCFTDCLGERLVANKWNALANPLGTVFNPASMAELLRYSLDQRMPAPDTYLKREGIYYNELLHSTFSAPDRAELTQHIQAAFAQVHQWLHQASWLLITLGTAFVYHRKSTGHLVTNCHQLPASLFERSLLSVEAIVTDFAALWQQLRAINPQLCLIITVSPVKHGELNTASQTRAFSIIREALGIDKD